MRKLVELLRQEERRIVYADTGVAPLEQAAAHLNDAVSALERTAERAKQNGNREMYARVHALINEIGHVEEEISAAILKGEEWAAKEEEASEPLKLGGKMIEIPITPRNPHAGDHEDFPRPMGVSDR